MLLVLLHAQTMDWQMALAAAAALSLMGGCYVVNESYVDPDGATGTTLATEGATSMASTGGSATSTSTSTSTSAATSASSAGTGGTSTTTDTGAATSTASTGSTGASTGDATTGLDTTTGGLPPGTYQVTPTIATCVLLDNGNGYGPPAVCSGNADQQNGTGLSGLMMVDTSVSSGNGADRRAESYLRFDIPAEYAGLTVTSATLHTQVPDGGGNSINSGSLWLSADFSDVSLATSAPATSMLLVNDQGPVSLNQAVSWAVPTNLVTPGAALTLAILPTSSDGVFYRGETTPGAPFLELVVQ